MLLGKMYKSHFPSLEWGRLVSSQVQGAADTQALSECCGEPEGAKVAATAAARMEESVEVAVNAGKGVHCLYPLCTARFLPLPTEMPWWQGLQGWTVRSWPFPWRQMFSASACAWSWPQTKQLANSWLLCQQHTPAPAGITLCKLLLSTAASFSPDNFDVC